MPVNTAPRTVCGQPFPKGAEGASDGEAGQARPAAQGP
jgi:hypothetical protein